jgi:hypothetical protein
MPFANNKRKAKAKIIPFNRTPKIPVSHFFENSANTIPNSESVPRITIPIVIFALGPLNRKNAKMLAITVKDDRIPNLFI